MTSVLTFLVQAYKALISPIVPFNQCRFYPSCSDYAIEALKKFGAAKGLWLTVKRVARCHPFHKAGGYDPIP